MFEKKTWTNFILGKMDRLKVFQLWEKTKADFKGCPSKNFNIDKLWDSVIFPFFRNLTMLQNVFSKNIRT